MPWKGHSGLVLCYCRNPHLTEKDFNLHSGNATGKSYSMRVVFSKCFVKQLPSKKTNVDTSSSETMHLYGSENYLIQPRNTSKQHPGRRKANQANK